MLTFFQKTLLGTVAGGALLIALVVAAKGTPGAAATVVAPGPAPQIPPGVVASGEGTVKVKPDIAIVNAGVTAQAPTAAEAQQQNADRMSRVIARARQLGIAEKDIRTSGYSIQPQYAYEQGKVPRITSYQAVQQLSLTIRDVSAAGKVVDALVQNDGATNLSVRFTLDDGKPVQADARRLAVEDARAKAEAMAKAAGVRLGGVVSVTELGGAVPLPRFDVAMPAAAPAKVELPTGELDVLIRVQVQFAIGG